MRTLQDLIQRFSESLRTDVHIKESASDLIKEVIGVSISPDNINIKNGVLELKVSPGVKSEIYLRQEKLLTLFIERKIPIRRILYN